MDPILFFTPGTCALACMIALEWRGEPYSVCRVEREERSGERYRRINPRAQVPALHVDGKVLVEVNAILTHITDRAPDLEMLPRNGTWERDVANQWLSYFASGLHPAFWPFYSPARYAADVGAYETVKSAAVSGIRRELAFVDNHLATNEYVLGGTQSVLDGYLYAMARWGSDMLDLKEFSNVFRHLKLMTAHPLVRHSTAIERGREPPTPSKALQAQWSLATLNI